MFKKSGWLILLIAIAVFFRLYLLHEVPAGMTHDEADHGVDAWGVVNGIRPLYFTVGYGREPFFDYATALLMSFIGPTYLAGRLTSVLCSIFLLIGMYGWVNRAFNRPIALLTTAGFATSFWAVMTARHALRTVSMPMFLVLSLLLFWVGISAEKRKHLYLYIVGAGVMLGASFYTYMPGRILWFLYPCILLFTFLFQREQFKVIWKPILAILAIMATIAYPLLKHIQQNGVEERLSHLNQPIKDAQNGDWSTILTNTAEALQLFTIKGDFGEIIWRYNIPEKPWLSPVMGILFYIGIGIALITLFNRNKKNWQLGSAVALCWLVGGMVPSFITGLEASTTRAIGMQPILYFFPALTLYTAWQLLQRWKIPTQFGMAICVALFAWEGANTAQDYFVTWGNHPETRLQYESTLTEMMGIIKEEALTSPLLSVDDPARFHDPATALMMLGTDEIPLGFFNGRHALLLSPQENSNLLFSTGADIGGDLRPFIPQAPTKTKQLRDDDLDPTIYTYQFDTEMMAQQWNNELTTIPPVQYGGVLSLTGYKLLPQDGQLQLITSWEIHQAHDELSIFTHVLQNGTMVGNVTRLDAPSYYWQSGMRLLQLHTIPTSAVVTGESVEILVGVADIVASKPEEELFVNLLLEDGQPRYSLTTYEP